MYGHLCRLTLQLFIMIFIPHIPYFNGYGEHGWPIFMTSPEFAIHLLYILGVSINSIYYVSNNVHWIWIRNRDVHNRVICLFDMYHHIVQHNPFGSVNTCLIRRIFIFTWELLKYLFPGWLTCTCLDWLFIRERMHVEEG